LFHRFNILVAESRGFSEDAAKLLRQTSHVILADLDQDDLIAAVPQADVLWVRLRNRLDSYVFDHAPRLKIIVSPTTGLNHIDIEEAERRGLQVLSLRGETEFLKNVHATAEHTVTLALALLRHVPAAARDVLKGNWDRDSFKGYELGGKTLGVVGYGRLGRLVARLFRAFGTQVLTCDPNVSPQEVDPDIVWLSFSELLEQSDIVSLHVDLNIKSKQFFGKAQFDGMKDGAWFINTARGELVDELALLDALKNEKLRGAALDVLQGEDARGFPALSLLSYAREHENLLITPHIGGCTFESMAKTELYLASRLDDLLRAHSHC
jgi:D-3-phosphoglycerate dehydrogenase